MTRLLLDAREMEHPEPLEKAIAILRGLDEESYLYMLHRREPVPLTALAREHGLNALVRCDEQGEWHILISRNRDIDLEAFLLDRDSRA
ncbi:DUF2249 domain-containing protein [Nitratifractor sp.]|uniref:DUF2249 domain-containing protein n=1 Tax=Nitratifractor sp. TaxID=2268144 RepID=UPI0025D72630|nr:DUF2249 domain-containing protein [Nitratifractor sp.]